MACTQEMRMCLWCYIEGCSDAVVLLHQVAFFDVVDVSSLISYVCSVASVLKSTCAFVCTCVGFQDGN